MPKIKLSLQESEIKPQGQRQTNTPPPEKDTSIAGYFAVGLALLGLFTTGYIFVLLSFVASIIALLSSQILLGILRLMLSITGLLMSPALLTLLGAAWLAFIVVI
jgi:hypothetical protein